MRATRYEQTGLASEVLKVGELKTPDASEGEVRTKIISSAVNPADAKLRSGQSDFWLQFSNNDTK